MSKEQHINIVSWMATEKDPGRIKFICDRLSRDYTIDNVLYIYQLGFAETLKHVQKALGPLLKPILVELPNSANALDLNPWNHKDVYGILKCILPKISSYKNLYVNVSSGTYAIHAAWLILHAGGALPPDTKMIVADAEKKYFHEVDFPITTYLSEIREYERKHPKAPTFGLESKSPKRTAALEKITAFASMKRRPMLLLGERGTGKSRIVESYISAIKKRKNVISVVCGSFAMNDPAIAEDALFGHTKEAYTGAKNDKNGLLKEADGGILFLDEIQDLPKLVQRKLLRTLQDEHHRFRKIGAKTEDRSDFELVCASNLPEEELKKRLDLDFYDRISFFKVTLPPLRDCPEELCNDWQKVWIAESSGLETLSKAPEDKCLMDFFNASQLPGNFRTLELVANHIIAWNGRKSIEDILKDLTSDHVEKNNTSDFSAYENMSWKDAIRCFQQQYAEYACKKYGTQGKAAEKLGCTTKTLQNALKK